MRALSVDTTVTIDNLQKSGHVDKLRRWLPKYPFFASEWLGLNLKNSANREVHRGADLAECGAQRH